MIRRWFLLRILTSFFLGVGGGQGGTYILELEIACAHWPNTRTLMTPLKKCSLLASLMNP